MIFYKNKIKYLNDFYSTHFSISHSTTKRNFFKEFGKTFFQILFWDVFHELAIYLINLKYSTTNYETIFNQISYFYE